MGFVSSLFGATNNFNATGATNLQTSDYQQQIKDALMQAGKIDPNSPNNAQSNATAAQQGQLAQMLMKQAQGQGGPSPAENMLTQASNQNTANSAAQLAGVRGMNPAAAARLIQQQGMNQGQQLANQAGVLRANEQLQNQNQLAGLLGTQRGQDLNQAQGNVAAMQGNTNLLGTLGGLQNQQNAGQIQNALGAQQINSGVAAGNAQTNAAVSGGILSSLAASGGGSSSGGGGGGGMMSMMGGMAHGGMVPGYDEGGFIEGSPLDAMKEEMPVVIPQSTAAGVPAQTVGAGAAAGVDAGSQVTENVPNMAQTPGTTSQVPQYGDQNPGAYKEAGQALGKGIGDQIEFIKKMFTMGMGSKGGNVVGGSAPVKGDDPKNDTVPAMLSPGEAVLPRSVTQSKDAPEKAKEFMKALKQHHAEATGPQGYAKVLAAHRNLDARMKELEKLAYGGMCG